MAGDKPNIILITSDQQRYDTIGANGSVVRTPVLDALAAEGSRFVNSFCNNTVCIPSRACIHTGRYTHQHGVRYMDPVIDKTPGLPVWETTFMERLQVAGYRTGAVGKIHMMPPKGFDYEQLTMGQGARWNVPYGSPYGPSQLGDVYAAWLEKKNPGAYRRIYEQRQSEEYRYYHSAVTSVLKFEEYVDYWATEKAIEFIHSAKNEPFFLMYGLCNPHAPDDAPAPYDKMYDPDQIILSEQYLKRPASSNIMPPELMRRWIAYYYGLCTMVDDLIGMVVNTLHELQLWDNTLIIFTSDHGEMMGDFGKMGKGNFYEQVIHMPLIIKPPKSERQPQPVINDMVEHIDLAPTIMDYAGVRIPDTTQGISLRPVMHGARSGKEQILSEFSEQSPKKTIHGKCLRTERYKYVIWAPSGSVELYDLQNDPHEWHNLAGDSSYSAVLTEMQERLITQLLLSEKPILLN